MKNIPIQILFSNVRGLGIHNKSKYRLNGINHKLTEFTASSKFVPSIYVCLETKLRSTHKKIKLPRGCKYGGETSGEDGRGGIFVYFDNLFSIKDRKNDVKTIVSKIALYIKVQVGDSFLNLIPVYLPSCTIQELVEILDKISNFISINNLSKVCFFGDLNIDFNQIKHKGRATAINNFFKKHNLFNLAEKLAVFPGYTWRGAGMKIQSKSYLDHFFCNFDYFNLIEFSHTSYSDHKSVRIKNKQKYIYKAPAWQPSLFAKDEFLELINKETACFLRANADQSNNENHSLNDLSFSNIKNQSAGTMFNLIQHLKKVHDRFFSQLRLKDFKKTKEFNSQISKLYDKIEKSDSIDSRQKIKELIELQQTYFKNLVHSRSELYYMRFLLLDGLPNGLIFQKFKQKKKRNYNLLIDNELTNCPEKIAKTFGNIYAATVSPAHVPDSDLNDLLRTFDLKLEDIFPRIENLTSPYSTTEEFLKVIKSLKNTSSPGPSTQPKALYLFLFSTIPNLATNAFNQMYDMDLDNSDLAFVKLRNVCFLPKKDLDQSDPKNQRPICLCETPLKILDKSLNNKVSKYMHQIVHCDQFGFIKQRHMATASLSISSVINYVKSRNIDTQLIFFDLKSAFDRTLYDVTEKIISHIFPLGNFAKCLLSISNGGKFKAIVGKYSSEVYEHKLGYSQGLPSSANKFDIYNHLFCACLKSIEMKQLTLNIKGKTLPPVSFADDGFNGFTLKSESDVIKVSNLLKKLKSTVNIEINFTKTKILTYGNHPRNINLLGTPCNSVKHLGIYLSFDDDLAYNLTYNELNGKLSARSNNLFFYGANIFKRRNVCFAAINTMAFHIFRVYNPNKIQEKKIWKNTARFLWSNGAGSRHKVAKKRIEMNFVDGGLNMLLPKQQSFIIWLTSFFNILKHANNYPESNLGIILSFKHVPISSVLSNFGSKLFKKYTPQFKTLYPLQSQKIFSRALSFLKQLEEHPSTFLHSTISSSVWAHKISFSVVDNRTLKNQGLLTVASILKSLEIKNKHVYLPIIKDELIQSFQNMPILYTKLIKVIENIGKKFEFNTLDCISSKKKRIVLKPIITLSFVTPSIFSFHFKRLYKAKIWCPHPTLRTRKNDNIWSPDPELFKRSFSLVLSLPITLYFKGFLFEQYIRTLVSRTKLFEWKMLDNNLCIKCGVKSDSDHALFTCFFPRYFINCLSLFLDKKFNNGKPDFIFLKENFYLFNIYYEVFTIEEFTQITLLSLVAKDRSLKINKDTCLDRWTIDNCISQAILLTQFTSKLLDEAGLSSELVDNFLEYMLM